MKKKIAFSIGMLVMAGLIWYLFIKPYDYLVTFKAKTFPGTINQSIKLWGGTINGFESTEQKNLYELKQQFKFGDSIHVYNWKIEPINDSLSQVKVYVTDIEHSLKNKISVPFSTTDFEKRTVKTVTDLNKKLNEHIKKFKVTILGEEEFKSSYCAYITVKGTQYEKAGGMMRNYPFLSTILAKNDIALNGTPFVEITHWDKKTDSITYNFCFPIIRSENLPELTEIKYKSLEEKKALKAIYNGNYITSDRAWYALLDYAKKESIEVEERPIEIFYNNPNMGGNELNWKAEIYMPIK